MKSGEKVLLFSASALLITALAAYAVAVNHLVQKMVQQPLRCASGDKPDNLDKLWNTKQDLGKES